MANVQVETIKAALSTARVTKIVDGFVDIQRAADRADFDRLSATMALAKGVIVTEAEFETLLRPGLKKAYEAANLSASSLSKAKTVFLATVAGLRPSPGQGFDAFYNACGADLAAAKLADGRYVMTRKAGTDAPAPKRGRAKGTAGKGKTAKGKTAPESAGTSEAAHAPNVATAREDSAAALMGGAKAGADLLRVITEAREDLNKFLAAKIAELDESKAKERAGNASAIRLDTEAAARASKLAGKPKPGNVNGASVAA